MKKHDEQYFIRHALGAGNNFEWDDPYVEGYEDDPSLPLDDDIFLKSDGEPMDDEFLFEEE